MNKTITVIDPDEFLEKMEEKFRKIMQETLSQSRRTEKLERNEYLTKKEVCAMLQISASSLDRYSRLGYLQTMKVGRSCRYKLADVQKFIIKLNR